MKSVGLNENNRNLNYEIKHERNSVNMNHSVEKVCWKEHIDILRNTYLYS